MKMLDGLIKRGSPGVSKILIIVVGVLAVGGWTASKIGPVYTEKWEFEDRMQSLLRTFPSIGEDGVWDGLDRHIRTNKLPLDAYNNCTFEGEMGQPGKIECKYKVKVDLKYYQFFIDVDAVHSLPKIPYNL